METTSEEELIDDFAAYCASASFQSTFEAFFLLHSPKFTDEEEHPLFFMGE